MAHVREKTQQRNLEIIEAYYEEGLSYTTLTNKYGLSLSAISQLIKKDKIQNGPRERKAVPVDPRRLDERQPLSFLHASIGIHVSRFISQKSISPTQFGLLGENKMSRVVVREITMGVHDLTLSQVKHLADVIGVPFDTLINPPKERSLVHSY